MPQIANYLSFDGTCAEAMRFYEKVLKGNLKALLTNAQGPGVLEHIPPGNDDRIMHAYLEFDGCVLMAGDSVVGWGEYKGMHGFNLTLSYETVDRAREVFDALAEGGRVTMPFGPTFWAEVSGSLIDRFGTPWIINGGAMPTVG